MRFILEQLNIICCSLFSLGLINTKSNLIWTVVSERYVSGDIRWVKVKG